MPNKPVRFGMKVWSLCESTTGYLYDFQIYTGKVLGQREVNLTTRVVTDLMSPLYGTNAQVCFDNFYTSVNLLQVLLRNKIFAWGTVRANRKDLPKDILPKNIKATAKHEYKMAQMFPFLFTVWRDTKYVCFLSNCHSPSDFGVVNRRAANNPRSQVDVPQVVSDYQKHMKGVDLCDQLVSYYMAPHKSLKWWRRLFFYFTQVSMINAHILAKADNTECIPLLRFIEEVANGLIGNYRAGKPRHISVIAPHQLVVHEIVQMYPKNEKKTCKECLLLKPGVPAKNLSTYHGCDICKVPVHLSCHGHHMRRMFQLCT